MSEKKMKLKRKVAARLRELRGAESQESFARRIGVEQTQVSGWEAGKSMPGLENLIRIKAATGADLIEEGRGK
jgi:transcriptional regulator with XRE-family HTH domain